jgi:hypothetical protein
VIVERVELCITGCGQNWRARLSARRSKWCGIRQRKNLICGKMVIEAKSSARQIGHPVEALMGESPFLSHAPILAGADQTNKDAF